MWLPKFCYEVLPFAYLIVGVITLLKIHSAVGVTSGVLLIIAGIATWKMRKDYRTFMNNPEAEYHVIKRN